MFGPRPQISDSSFILQLMSQIAGFGFLFLSVSLNCGCHLLIIAWCPRLHCCLAFSWRFSKKAVSWECLEIVAFELWMMGRCTGVSNLSTRGRGWVQSVGQMLYFFRHCARSICGQNVLKNADTWGPCEVVSDGRQPSRCHRWLFQFNIYWVLRSLILATSKYC